MKQKIVLIVSVAVGLMAAVLTRGYLAAKDAEVARMKTEFESRHGTSIVLCYARDIPGGTTISRKDLGIIKVMEKAMQGHALSEENAFDIIGRKTIAAHKKGDVVFWADIEGGDPAAAGLAHDIRKTKRALSINVSGASAVSGMVKPNDHVDVIGTFSFPAEGAAGRSGQSELVTFTVIQNVLVLATGRETAKSMNRRSLGTSGSGYSTVTLEVSPREAEMLVFAEQIKGRLTLALRNRTDGTYERELPKVDFSKIRSEIETLNLKRQSEISSR